MKMTVEEQLAINTEWARSMKALKQLDTLWIENLSSQRPEKYGPAEFERLHKAMQYELKAHKATYNNPSWISRMRGQMILLGKIRKTLSAYVK